MKKVYISEVNALGIKGLSIDDIFVLDGSCVNLAYNINGNSIKLWDNNATYMGNQVHKSGGRCYGIVCCEKYILVSEYGKDGANPEIVALKRREN